MSRSSPTLLQRSQRLTEASRISLDEMIQLESKSVEVIVHARDAVAHAVKQSDEVKPATPPSENLSGVCESKTMRP